MLTAGMVATVCVGL